MFIDVWRLYATIPCACVWSYNFNLQPVGIGRIQNDMQACIQSFFEAFRLFLVFSAQTKPSKTLHLNVSCSKQKKQKKKHFNAEIRLPFDFLVQIGLIIFLFFRYLSNLFISNWSLWSNSTHLDELHRVENSKASQRAKQGNWIQLQAGINTNVPSQKRAIFVKAWDKTLHDWKKS